VKLFISHHHLSNWPVSGLKGRNCSCGYKRHPSHWCTSPYFGKSHRGLSAYRLVTAAVYKSPCHSWSDDIIESLSSRRNAKNTVWNSQVPNFSDKKILDLFEGNDFQFSVQQCPIHCTPQVNGNVLDTALHKHARPSDVTVSDILDSDHLSIFFHILIMLVVGYFESKWKFHRFGAVSKPCLWMKFFKNPNSTRA
jgi:hypothetical protein